MDIGVTIYIIGLTFSVLVSNILYERKLSQNSDLGPSSYSMPKIG